MTTNSLYLILCVAGSLTLLAFTQKTTDSQALAENASTSVKSIMHERPTTSTTSTDNSTTSSTSTTSSNSSTSTDFPVAPVNTGTEVANPGVGSTRGGTTTTDIPTNNPGTPNY